MRKNERGFEVYAEFDDSYGSDVRVQESSSAGEPHVWIFCHNQRYGQGEQKDFTPHLTVEQAKIVRDALDEFIRKMS